MYRSGFVSIVGSPNAGKSTLLNKVINKKVSIISDKVQTTRDIIKGIYHEDDMQIVFLDTPGFHKPKNKLQKYMNDQIDESMDDIEVIVYMLDAKFGIGKKELEILERLSKINVPKIAFVNKIDLISQEKTLYIIEKLEKYEMFSAILAGSVKENFNTQGLLNEIKQHIPEGVMYYEKGQNTDNPIDFQISEIIREKVLKRTYEEVPHSIGVKVMEMEDEGDKLYISAVIYVERESQKGIIIGKKASMIKQIGIEARKELSWHLDKKIYLDLKVKVLKDWQQKMEYLSDLGYNS